MQKIFFKSCRKFQIYPSLPKSVFCGYTSIITYFHYNFMMEWWFIKPHSYTMSNKAWLFKLNVDIPSVTAYPCYLSPHSPLQLCGQAIKEFSHRKIQVRVRILIQGSSTNREENQTLIGATSFCGEYPYPWLEGEFRSASQMDGISIAGGGKTADS